MAETRILAQAKEETKIKCREKLFELKKLASSLFNLDHTSVTQTLRKGQSNLRCKSLGYAQRRKRKKNKKIEHVYLINHGRNMKTRG